MTDTCSNLISAMALVRRLLIHLLCRDSRDQLKRPYTIPRRARGGIFTPDFTCRDHGRGGFRVHFVVRAADGRLLTLIDVQDQTSDEQMRTVRRIQEQTSRAVRRIRRQA